MKIAYVTSEKLPVPPVDGGAVETWIYEVAQRINADAASFCVYTPKLDEWPEQTNFRIFSYRYDWLAHMMLCSYKLPFKNERSLWYFYPYARWCAKTANEWQAEIIHNHSRPQFIPVLRQWNPKAKIILHVHNVSAIEMEGYLWPQKLMDQIDLIATCSEYLRNEVLNRYPYLADKVVTLYNGVDIDRFSSGQISSDHATALRNNLGIQSDEKIIFFSGRLVGYKGVHLLIDAFKSLVKKFPRTRLLIMGGLTYSNNEETSYIRDLKKSAHELGDRILFTGYVAHAEIPLYLRLADIVVIPSLWDEPFGVVVIEAMSMEKPVVAFARGGIPEIISHHSNGWLLPKMEPRELAEACHTLMSNAGLCNALGTQARKDVEQRFSWEKIVKDTQSLYARLLKKAYA